MNKPNNAGGIKVIKFKYNGIEKELNRKFWEVADNLKNMDENSFKELEKAVENLYKKGTTYESVVYYMKNLRFSHYTVDSGNKKSEKKYKKVKNYFNIEEDNDNYDEFLKKLIKFSEIIQKCAQKSNDWFNNTIIECLKNIEDSNNEKNEKEDIYEIENIDEKSKYTDSFGNLENYLWYKHKLHYKENPISLSFFLNEDGNIKVAIELHESRASKTHIKELFIAKVNKIIDVIQNPENNALISNYFELKYVKPNDNDKSGQNEEGEIVKDSELEANDTDRIQFYFEILKCDDLSDNKIKVKVEEQISKLIELYRNVSNVTIYEREIYKSVNARNIKQIIFNGAPGTGKTFGVKKYAIDATQGDETRWKIIQFHPSYDYTDFVEGIRPISTNEEEKEKMSFVKIDGEFKRFCRVIVNDRIKECLEFIKTLEEEEKSKIDEINREYNEESKKNMLLEYIFELSKKDNDKILNNVEKELLKKFNAIESKDSKIYYFIIDEINRADISKVFGELMYGFEYRGIQHRISTQYSQLDLTYHKDEKNSYSPLVFDCFKDGFFVPHNVVLIGTMNDIDKNVEAIDFAMRRRFHWVPIKANDVMKLVLEAVFCENYIDYQIYNPTIKNLVEKIKIMNKNIVDNGKKYGLTEDYQIGPSYFKNFDILAKKEKEINDAFNREFELVVQPTLIEYVRGRADDNQIKEFIKNCKDLSKTKK